MESDIEQRKTDHIDLAVRGEVGFKKTTTLLEDVRLIHNALPDLHVDEIDLTVNVLGKRLRAPILIAAMTGGTDRAGDLNRQLARLAETRGYAFGLGSQRAMWLNDDLRASYQVREMAPHTLVLGNVGVVQARDLESSVLRRIVTSVQADALCVHLNPAMEVVQPGGDRDFSRGTETLARLVTELGVPVVAKETGCGISQPVAARLYEAGVRHVDVSGAGGTSWVAVETHRATKDKKALGKAFWDWGIPTAASVIYTSRYSFETVFATGGIHTGLDVARALALGATVGGIARPVLQVLVEHGWDGAMRFFDDIEAELRAAMLLVGAKNVGQLRDVPRVISGELRDWL